MVYVMYSLDITQTVVFFVKHPDIPQIMTHTLDNTDNGQYITQIMVKKILNIQTMVSPFQTMIHTLDYKWTMVYTLHRPWSFFKHHGLYLPQTIIHTSHRHFADHGLNMTKSTITHYNWCLSAAERHLKHRQGLLQTLV